MSDHPGPATAPLVRHQFDDAAQQHVAYTLGMWIFLATEVLFFGGMFTLFTVDYIAHPLAFHLASREMEIALGTLNTGVLLLSSLTMALAIWHLEHDLRRRALRLMLATMVLGTVFIGIKAVEYALHFKHGHWPGGVVRFEFPDSQRESAQLFFALYFTMTGLHALHLLIGIGVVGLMAVGVWREHYGPGRLEPIIMTGLYWHFVDIVWIFLFPLFYLIGRSP